MFNLNKALEVALTGGICLLTGERSHQIMETLKRTRHLKSWKQHSRNKLIISWIRCFLHAKSRESSYDLLPSPFLSASIENCMENGMDVTAGGAKIQFIRIQMIQVANLADSLVAIKQLVYDEKSAHKRNA